MPTNFQRTRTADQINDEAGKLVARYHNIVVLFQPDAPSFDPYHLSTLPTGQVIFRLDKLSA